MKSILFSYSLVLMLLLITSLKTSHLELAKYNVNTELNTNDIAVKRLMDNSGINLSYRYNGQEPNLTIYLDPEQFLTINQKMNSLGDYTSRRFSVPDIGQAVYLRDKSGNFSLKVNNTGTTKTIRIQLDDYSSFEIFFPSPIDYQAPKYDWSAALDSSGNAKVRIRMNQYSTDADESCGASCYVRFSSVHKKVFNLQDKYGANRLMNMSFDYGIIEINYTGDFNMWINITTNSSIGAFSFGNSRTISLDSTENCSEGRKPSYAGFINSSSEMFGNFNGNNLLVVNSTAGHVLFADRNGNCNFDDFSDFYMARGHDFLALNRTLYFVDGLNQSELTLVEAMGYVDDNHNPRVNSPFLIQLP